MRQFTVLAMAIALSVPLAHARGNLTELTVPLKFAPQEGVHASTANLPPALLEKAVSIQVEDVRKLKDLRVIGQGTGGDDKQFPILADREVRAFVQEAITAIGTAWSLKQEGTPSRILKIQITGFTIDESNKALGSVYGAEVKLAYTLSNAQGGALASGVVSGTAHRYGRAHSPENINEVLSDALKEAYANVLADQPLQTAWVSGKAVAPGNGTAQPPESAEERLRKLDDLLKKGLITKEEYQAKRAEILKQM